MLPRTGDSDDRRVFTSYSRRRGEYRYDVAIYETTLPTAEGLFRAQVLNMVRLEDGHPVSVNAELEDAFGGTPDEAYSTLEGMVEAWMKDPAPSD
jgi:hypothetical protein